MGRSCVFVKRPLDLPPASSRPPLKSNKQKVGPLQIGDIIDSLCRPPAAEGIGAGMYACTDTGALPFYEGQLTNDN